MTTTLGREAHFAGTHVPTDETNSTVRAQWASECVYCARLYTATGEFAQEAREESYSRRETWPQAGTSTSSYNRGSAPARTVRPASEKQIDLINKLWGEKDVSDMSDTAKTDAQKDIRLASALIDVLFKLPRKVVVRKDFAVVPSRIPAGRYAVVDPSDDVLKFYVVDAPTEGNWKGYIFVSVQASDDLYPVRGARKGQILDLIARDPKAASARYGRELGCCGVCNRTLTDEESRARGIGPVCYEKF